MSMSASTNAAAGECCRFRIAMTRCLESLHSKGETMQALAKGYGLIEGPVWDPQRGLLFSDVLFGGVYALSRSGSVSTLFEHRRGIGGMALHTAGGLVVSGRNVSYKPFDGGPTVTLLDSDP